MKNVLFALAIATSFLSCVKPNAPVTTPVTIWTWTGTDPMSAEIEGSPWQCIPYAGVYSDLGSSKSVNGFDGALNSISVAASNLSPGEYDLSNGNGVNNGVYLTASGINYSSAQLTNGKVKVLENDGTHVKGLFYFNGMSLLTGSKVKVTKGYFNVTNWNWTGTDPMSAEIDGTPWQASSGTYFGTMTPFAISGTDASTNVIGITCGADFPIGEFDLFGSTANIGAVTNSVTGDVYNSTYMNLGRVKVLENDATHVKGLFYFNAQTPTGDLKTRVSKGYFNITK